MRRSTTALMVLGVIAFAACDDDPVDTGVPETLELSLTGLEPLINGFHYEGWAIINGTPVTTGKFNVESGVEFRGTWGTGVDLSNATAIVITIEPLGDVDAVPASTHIVAGPVAGGSAALSVGDGSALGDDFTGASGFYILATPTNGDDTDENSGIWFRQAWRGPPIGGQ